MLINEEILSVIFAASVVVYLRVLEVFDVPVVLVVVVVEVCVSTEIPNEVNTSPVTHLPLLEVIVIIPSSIVA